MTLDEVKSRWDAVIQHSTIPGKDRFARYREGHIFDEDQSVKWNREEVARRNAAYAAESARLRREASSLERMANDATVQYIMEEYSFNENQARALWSFVFDKYHAFMGDAFDEIDEYADFAKDMIKFGEEGK